ncbi:MAG: two-component regulator propeller domain-containing protein [Chitinophagaceae bacterium]
MRLGKKILLCILSLCSLQYAGAQQSLNFENYSSDHGLSQLSCYALAQDSNGFIWVGTQDGLNRYDGRLFKVYAQQNEAGRKLPSNTIFTLYADSVYNLLWIGTSGGLCLYHPAGDSLARLSAFFPFAAALEKLPIKKIISFKKDEYWIIAFNNGLYYLNTATSTLRSYFNETENISSVTDITSHEGKVIVSLLYTLHELVPDGGVYQPQLLIKDYHFPQIEAIASYNHRLWVGTISDGCYQVGNPVGKKESIVAPKIIFGGIYCFAIDAANELWIGTRGSGIYRYSAATNQVTQAQHNQFLPGSPASNFVVFLLKDRQGNMWCGLSGGLSKYDPLSHQFGFVNGPASLNGSLLDKVIYSMYRAKDGTRFIGTQNRGLFEWKTGTNQFISFPASAVIGKANNVIYNITEDDDGNIWAATFGGLMQLERKTRKITYYPENKGPVKLNNMYAVTKLKKADSLLVSADDGLHFFSLKEKRWVFFPRKPENINMIRGFAAFKGIRHFYEDEQNTLWLCAPGAGLIRYHYLENKLETVAAVNNISPSVRHLLADGPVFLLATDNGLIVYDWKKNRLLRQVDIKANGVSNVCYAIQKDNQEYYWVSTNTGLRKLNRQYEVEQVYNTSNGLTFLEYNTGCTSKDTSGVLYFGGMGGVTFFDPAALKANTFSPQPVITGVLVNDVSRSLSMNKLEHLQLRHNENFLSFQFAVTNFSNEKNNRFSYRLKGLSDSWSTLTTTDKAGFTSLPPGEYVFELKSVNSDGHWSAGVTMLGITILSPWWQTWWFITGACLLLAGLLTWLIRRRILAIKREAELKHQIAEAEMMAMRAQMNPHFVFNSLNSIREMILSNENEAASHFLGKFASLIRITLDQSERSFVSLRQTISHLTRYMEIEQIRNGEFTSRILADDELDLDEVMLPSMLIQPFVENALWHGTTSTRKNININIDFKKEKGQLLCIVEDDGIGIRQSLKNKTGGSRTHHSLGLENVSNRIRLLNEKYHLESSILINDKSELDNYTGTGTVVQLFLPLQINAS